jgi:hypothetical protein
MKTKIYTFVIVLFNLTFSFSQPFILNVQPDDDAIDTLDYQQVSEFVRSYWITADYLQRIDLTTNESIDVFKDSVRINNVIYLVKDSLALIVQETVWSIYDIYNNSIVQSFPPPLDCLVDGVLINNSIYGFSCDDSDYNDFTTKIFLIDLQNHNPLFLCKIPFYGFDLVLNCSINGDIHFQVEDTNYIPIRYDLSKLVSFSTTTNQFVNQTNLSTLGRSGANGYSLYKGHNGIGIIESYFNDDVLESYFKAYDFNNHTGSNFIFHQGDVTPTISIDNKYLILSETYYHAGYVLNTGSLYIYNISNTELVQTINLPPNGTIYTFDNYPENVYYVIDLESSERQIHVIKIDSNY